MVERDAKMENNMMKVGRSRMEALKAMWIKLLMVIQLVEVKLASEKRKSIINCTCKQIL